MLRELIVAMKGCEGDIFPIDNDGNLTISLMLKQFPQVHPAELEQYKQLLVLGNCYRYLSDFTSVKSYESNSDPSSVGVLETSLYLRGLQQGVDRELNAYVHKLVNLEVECVQDEAITPTYFFYHLDDELRTFPFLVKLIQEVKSRQARGAGIFSVLHQRSHCGDPTHTALFVRLLHYPYRVLLGQISRWMFHAQLVGTRSEFFIQEGQVRDFAADDGHAASNRSLSCIGGVETDCRSYTVRTDLLVPFISSRCAEDILFCGLAHKQLAAQENFEGVEPARDLEARLAQLMAESTYSHRGVFDELTERSERLRKVVSAARQLASEQLWRLAVDKCHLVDELTRLRDVFLLGAGHFAGDFLTQADPVLTHRQPSQLLEVQINRLFQAAGAQCPVRAVERGQGRGDTEEEPITTNFFLLLSAPANGEDRDTAAGASQDAWDQLAMGHTVPGPLRAIITPKAVDTYNRMFRFLLRIRRALHCLTTSWLEAADATQTLGQEAGVSHLHQHMHHVTHELYAYVQTDVVHAEHTRLLQELAERRDYMYMVHAHEAALTRIVAECFFLQPAVLHCIHEMLSSVFKFCYLTRNMQQSPGDPRHVQHMQAIKAAYFCHACKFYSSISGLEKIRLSQRIDFNRWFETNKLSEM